MHVGQSVSCEEDLPDIYFSVYRDEMVGYLTGTDVFSKSGRNTG
jgi:hypothetical protein